ncbi:MAG: hypothetical protein ACK4NY_20395 [Spirosomataceae bacterium]
MKKLSFFVILLIFSCRNQSPTSNEFVNREAIDANGSTMLIGRCTRSALYREPYKSWFETNYEAYKTDSGTIADLKPKINDYQITIFMGTWCGDTRREVPRFLKVLDDAEYKKAVNFVLVDNDMARYKQSPNHEEQGKNIFRVPTFIIEKNGVEINRIIERPVESLEKDLSEIMTDNSSYQPFYKAVPKLVAILQTKGLNYVENNYSSLATEFKPLLRSSSELNSFGYILLGQKKFDEAIAVLTLQTFIFPEDANTFDSLAEAFLMSGKKKLAIKYYEKALQVNPNFESSITMLKKLRG